jgi:hypothetical protein
VNKPLKQAINRLQGTNLETNIAQQFAFSDGYIYLTFETITENNYAPSMINYRNLERVASEIGEKSIPTNDSTSCLSTGLG